MLWHSDPMSKVVRLPSAEGAVDDRAQQALFESTLALVKTLLEAMPHDQKQRVAREVMKSVGPPESPKAGDVLASILNFVKKNQEFTVAEVRERVDLSGVSAAPKEIYNALGYLTRKGRVRRVGYGKYIVDGVSITTSDDLGGETTRTEDEYRTDRGS